MNEEKVIEIRNQNEKIYLMTNYVPQKYLKSDIKSIVTHEQFEQMKYVVEEWEDERFNNSIICNYLRCNFIISVWYMKEWMKMK